MAELPPTRGSRPLMVVAANSATHATVRLMQQCDSCNSATHATVRLIMCARSLAARKNGDKTVALRGMQEAPVTRLSFRESLAALQGAQKPRRGVSAYSIYVNRPAGRWVAAAANVLGLTPNHVTALSGASSFTAIGLLVWLRPSVLLGVVVGLALMASFVLDSADGQLARLHRTGSSAGEWLDHMVDCATKLGLHGAVLVAWYRFGVEGGPLLVPLGFQFVAVLLFFGGILVGKLREQAARGDAIRAIQWRGPRAPAVLLLPADHGVLCCSFLLWGWPQVFRGAYVALFLAAVAYLAAFCTTWFRELSR